MLLCGLANTVCLNDQLEDEGEGNGGREYPNDLHHYSAKQNHSRYKKNWVKSSCVRFMTEIRKIPLVKIVSMFSLYLSCAMPIISLTMSFPAHV